MQGKFTIWIKPQTKGEANEHFIHTVTQLNVDRKHILSERWEIPCERRPDLPALPMGSKLCCTGARRTAPIVTNRWWRSWMGLLEQNEQNLFKATASTDHRCQGSWEDDDPYVGRSLQVAIANSSSLRPVERKVDCCICKRIFFHDWTWSKLFFSDEIPRKYKGEPVWNHDNVFFQPLSIAVEHIFMYPDIRQSGIEWKSKWNGTFIAIATDSTASGMRTPNHPAGHVVVCKTEALVISWLVCCVGTDQFSVHPLRKYASSSILSKSTIEFVEWYR